VSVDGLGAFVDAGAVVPASAVDGPTGLALAGVLSVGADSAE